MRLQFLGSGDAFGSGGRFNTCFHLERANRGNVLIDCGASSMVAIRKWGVDPNAISTVLVTHLHGDHFGGLPFFLLDGQTVVLDDYLEVGIWRSVILRWFATMPHAKPPIEA